MVLPSHLRSEAFGYSLLEGLSYGKIEEGDAVICFNFRTDRCREITEVLTQKDFPEQEMKKLNLHYATMTVYDHHFTNVQTLFQNEDLTNNNSEYKRYRKAYKLRKTGLLDEFTLEDGTELISLTGLERAQKTLRGNRDLSLLVVIIGYVLQIVEASVNAHLLQFDASDNITVNPTIMSNPIKIEAPSVGFSFKYSF